MTDYTLHAKAILALDEGYTTAHSVAESIGCHEDTAYKLLNVLKGEGLAEIVYPTVKTFAGSTRAFWKLK